MKKMTKEQQGAAFELRALNLLSKFLPKGWTATKTVGPNPIDIKIEGPGESYTAELKLDLASRRTNNVFFETVNQNGLPSGLNGPQDATLYQYFDAAGMKYSFIAPAAELRAAIEGLLEKSKTDSDIAVFESKHSGDDIGPRGGTTGIVVGIGELMAIIDKMPRHRLSEAMGYSRKQGCWLFRCIPIREGD